MRLETGVKRHRFDVVNSVAPDGTIDVSSAWHNRFTLVLGFSFALDE